MSLQNTTPVPNRLFDLELSNLKEVELKVLLLIIRKTLGWVNTQNHRQRKQLERISIKSFEFNTGCSRRGISDAIKSLINKGLIRVYDYNGNTLTIADDRKGKYHLYFEPFLLPVENLRPRQNLPMTSANYYPKPAQNLLNTIKERSQKKIEKETGFIPNTYSSHASPFHISNHLRRI